MRVFYKLLGIGLVAATTNNFVWFALTFWIYLTTQSVVSTGLVGGTWLIASAISNFWLGSVVDHHKKKSAMVASSAATLTLFTFAAIVYAVAPDGSFESVNNPILWLLVILLMLGVVAGNIYAIAIPTLVAYIVPEDKRDNANGMFGTVMGISFAITSVASGLTLGFAGMAYVFGAAILLTLFCLIAISLLKIPEGEADKSGAHVGSSPHTMQMGEPVRKIDIRGTMKVISAVPGLFALILFTTFNNFLGGVFMALMDAYGLSLVSVQVWGMLWGVLSFGFIFGGIFIAKKGLGKNPLSTLFKINIIMWTVCIFFTIQSSILLLVFGIFIWMCLVPFVEATEQSIFQKVVPKERLGRVFGLAHSIEQAASPLTAFLIGPLTQFVFIPYMTTGAGVYTIGSWFGVGASRGIALVFTLSGVVGLIVTLVARRTKYYYGLEKSYLGK